MREAVIVSGVRTAVGKAPRGALRQTRPEDMVAAVMKEAVARVKGLDPNEIEDVVIGCAFPEAEQGMNVARVALLRAGLPITASGQTVNRFCSSGLQAVAIAAQAIMCGFGEVMVAGGVESMSLVPMGGNKMAPNPYLVENLPEAYLGMGLTAEEVAGRYSVSREDQDRFAVASHQKAAAAVKDGKFKGEILPLDVVQREIDAAGRLVGKTVIFDTDEGIRADTSLEGLAKLKPAFRQGGSVTAGNTSQTSDAAAALVVMEAKMAARLGLTPLATFRSFAVGGVAPEVMGIGPVEAIPKALKYAGLQLADIDLFEINEAFAAQAVAVIKTLGIDPAKVNVNGGAIALGHPLGCTGAKLSVSLLSEMVRRKARYGVVTMCIGGGMGAAGVFERAG
jgi:acetyl-CoA acyltransferase